MPRKAASRKKPVSRVIRASSRKAPARGSGAASRYRRDEQAVFRSNRDGSVSIMHFENEKYFFSLTGIAAEFWGLLDGVKPVEVLQEKLAKKHGVPKAQLASSVKRLIRDLARQKLIVRV